MGTKKLHSISEVKFSRSSTTFDKDPFFCTAKIVNVDKNAESKDEMRKKQTGLLKQRMLRKSCFFHYHLLIELVPSE